MDFSYNKEIAIGADTTHTAALYLTHYQKTTSDAFGKYSAQIFIDDKEILAYLKNNPSISPLFSLKIDLLDTNPPMLMGNWIKQGNDKVPMPSMNIDFAENFNDENKKFINTLIKTNQFHLESELLLTTPFITECLDATNALLYALLEVAQKKCTDKKRKNEIETYIKAQFPILTEQQISMKNEIMNFILPEKKLLLPSKTLQAKFSFSAKNPYLWGSAILLTMIIWAYRNNKTLLFPNLFFKTKN